MARVNFTDYSGSFVDDDSGIGVNSNYSSSTLNESWPPYISQSTTSIPFPPSPATTTTIMKKHYNAVPLIRFPSDGIVERIRPVTMKNSENGDFIVCRTNRGTYVAYRTTIVPEWVKRLVEEIEYQQR
ncbi:unnamed protein product [Rotaria sordida]|uniref:Uncharacterized protein n=1 Tax=Rotaria sordida TaxID=392033 RepID=A0A819FVV2_9BILA|nr:unnamed protein product [Rotaria sordida]CAF0817422.1 unnamed protein product [Rotaria sordida]CAF0819392.1 unnamed protein product [Rotaria sordida]CAF0823983.1 unnamed protein product [Rotaria sordida]CAF0876416.1 unnamed protein product [Rotaria sordida]